MNNQDPRACSNSAGSNIAAERPESVLETELELLRSEVVRINRLATSVYEMVASPKPCPTSCDKGAISTVSESLRDIRSIAEESREELEAIGKLLESQLGNLKLEY